VSDSSDNDASEKLTRRQAAVRLGISPTSVRRLEKRGDLSPTLGDKGKRLFEPGEVDALAVSRRPPASVAGNDPLPEGTSPSAEISVDARVFQQLEEGQTLPQVVCILGLPAVEVEASYERYVHLKRIDLQTPSVPAELAAAVSRLESVEARLRQVENGAERVHRAAELATELHARIERLDTLSLRLELAESRVGLIWTLVVVDPVTGLLLGFKCPVCESSAAGVVAACFACGKHTPWTKPPVSGND